MLGDDRYGPNEKDRHFQPNERQPSEGWTCVGNVTGWCGHVHQKFEAACRCSERDKNGCRSVGGYSDKVVVRVEDGELDHIQPYLNRNGEFEKLDLHY